jgi:propionyl-CoA carboxylase alpha chain
VARRERGAPGNVAAPMLDKILIANRGEIACRIARTCRRMGIRTVAVYSEADQLAEHVRQCDEHVAIGPAPASESYLDIERIVRAAKESGADAVHPGYGFLAENSAFAEALAQAGITFIGPPASAIRAMGDKLESKRIAEAAGVNTVPGHGEPIADADEAMLVAERIGYPVMIKAAAGGGGKGMRTARNDKELRSGLERARSEARSSFGDDRVLIERFVEQPRHIEIQVLADGHGNVVHLFERECSIQRRHQKVIEEAPSPFLDEATRAAMGEQAVRLAEAVGYVSAGTVEFIVDPRRHFYFLEMNTRLQVEHPVTELITGLDLVELMIRIAAGERLPFGQAEVPRSGWAIEARVYAEDPARGFLPSTGRLTRYVEPKGTGIRVDSGVREGDEVSMHYDPMIAKLCASGADRTEALVRLQAALDAFVVRGLETNLAFLSHVARHRRFREGRLSTGFIAEEYGERYQGPPIEGDLRARLAAVAVGLRLTEDARNATISGRLPGWRYAAERDWVVKLEGAEVPVRAERREDGSLGIGIDGRSLDLRLEWRPGEAFAGAVIDDEAVLVQVDRRPEGYLLDHAGAVVAAIVRSARAAELARRIPEKQKPDLSMQLIAPMPGLIVAIAVEPGEAVKAGQEVVVLEAMKMENVLRAERDGTVADIRVAPEDSVAADQVLVVFE